MPGVLRQRAGVRRRRLQLQRQFLLAAQQRLRHPAGQHVRRGQYQPVSHQPCRLFADNRHYHAFAKLAAALTLT